MMGTEKTYVLNQVHYQKFVRYCRKWIAKLGALDWQWYFEFEREKKDSLASFSVYEDGKAATITLSGQWEGVRPSERELEISAFHEIYEVTLHRLREMSEGGPSLEKDVEREIHAVVRRMENVLFGIGKQIG